MDELIDIYDANLNHKGVMERVQAHMAGEWHKTFHCWVVSSVGGGRILFQLRSPSKVNFPNMLDVSAAGHLEAGESVEEGVREVTEELGVTFAPHDLQFLGYRVEVADQSNGQRNREYQAVYLLRVERELADFSPQVEEITGLVWLGLSDGLQLFTEETREATVEGIRYDTDSEQWREVRRVVTTDDFLPRIQRYYLTACIMGRRILDGELPLAIS
jgi:isopentenyldiphosphate isomerase